MMLLAQAGLAAPGAGERLVEDVAVCADDFDVHAGDGKDVAGL